MKRLSRHIGIGDQRMVAVPVDVVNMEKEKGQGFAALAFLCPGVGAPKRSGSIADQYTAPFSRMVKGAHHAERNTMESESYGVPDVAIALTRRVLDDVDLPLLEKAILIVLAFSARTEEGTGIFPKMATLKRQVGCSERSVRNGIRRLEALGYVVQTKAARIHSPAEWEIILPCRATVILTPSRH